MEASNIKSLISAKEIVTENFLKELLESLPEPPNSSAVELAKAWKDEARKRINNLSVTLSHRVQPIVQLMLEQKLADSMDKCFSTIETVEPLVYDMALKYRNCFNTWVDSHACVSYKVTNTKLLGNLHVKDAFILTFFSFLTCRRTKNDNVLQLGIVGCSTTGKSTIFESCLMEGSHVTTNEAGVGRFQVGNKPVLMFHDISVRTLAMSKDSEKIKTIARTEPTVTKIHSTVYTLSPLFLFYSSNERLMTHRFLDTHGNRLGRTYNSQVNQVGKKRISEESLLAIQNRFIEVFVRHAPPLNVHDLPQCGGFTRIHAIFGLFKRVIRIMQNYNVGDFYSKVLIQYVIQGLCVNNSKHTSVMNCDLSHIIKQLIFKYIQPDQQQTLLQML